MPIKITTFIDKLKENKLKIKILTIKKQKWIWEICIKIWKDDIKQ